MTTARTPSRISARASSSRTRRPASRFSTRNSLAYLFLTALILYFLIPIWWLVVASTKDVGGLFNGTSGALWFDKTFAFIPNLMQLFTYNDGIYIHWLGNSLLYALTGGFGATVLAVLAGYGFAKYNFKGRRLMFSLLLGSVMVPLTALVIPTFILLSNVHMTDTIWAVILPSLLNPFGVYLMSVYTSNAVPDELLDAARVDGAGEIRTFFQVAFPLLRPAFVTVLLLSVVATWNNYFLPLAMLSNSKLFPITVGLGLWEGQASANNSGGVSLWGLIIIGSLVSIIPLVIAFLTLQKYWQGGLAIGSLK
ncbi:MULTISPECIES: carbohydrate ABC transporter permease [Subtercola]|uniref:Carbohydrate ABC transporter permease n=1 Tax=Subtercola vilae TaxID=2056433 RepID=A0A4T2BL00_9MICO|nr:MULTISPECIES: carbohydrate ABC transporter permease [Subtercola]MEA9985041.1 carbohydrate ABC transporter permease [Subtercola sp. RTI3]TIH31222.1 carbohydrate ABC transporter permease [Subtercola vilae]